MKKKFVVAALLLALLVFAIPIEHKYDKLFRFFSLTLVPEGLEVPKSYDKKIYFYVSDLIALGLFFISLFWFKIPLKRFFGHSLWIVFICAIASIAASPFASYPIPYMRLLQLLTPIVLFSFLAHAFNDEERSKITRIILVTLVVAGVFQSIIAITQYFQQTTLGLRLIGEPSGLCSFGCPNGHRWIFDRFFDRIAPTTVVSRASGTLPHPNVLGGFLAFSLLATYALFMQAKKGRFLLTLTLPFQFFAMSISYSRAALFGWALATCIWFALIFFKNGIKDSAVRFLALTVALSVIISAFLLHDQYVHRGGVVNYNTQAKASDQGRIDHQNVALRIMQKNPVFGLGFSQFSVRAIDYFPAESRMDRSTAPHNIYLFLACETGLISLGAFLLFIGALLLAAFRTTITIETSTFTALFIAFLFIGCCDFYFILFQQGKLMFFLLAGLLAAHVNFKKISYVQSNHPRHGDWTATKSAKF